MKVKRARSLTLILMLLFLTDTVMVQAKISATVAERTKTEILPNGDSIDMIMVTSSRQVCENLWSVGR